MFHVKGTGQVFSMQMFLLLFNRVSETGLEVPQARVQDVHQNVHIKKFVHSQTNCNLVCSQCQALSCVAARQVTL